MNNQQELNKIKTLLQQVKREKSSEKRQQIIIQILEILITILQAPQLWLYVMSKTDTANTNHQELIYKMKVITDLYLEEIKTDLKNDNVFNCNRCIETIELLRDFIIVDAQLNHMNIKELKEKS